MDAFSYDRDLARERLGYARSGLGSSEAHSSTLGAEVAVDARPTILGDISAELSRQSERLSMVAQKVEGILGRAGITIMAGKAAAPATARVSFGASELICQQFDILRDRVGFLECIATALEDLA